MTVLPPESVTYVHVAIIIVLMTYIPPYNLAYSIILYVNASSKKETLGIIILYLA